MIFLFIACAKEYSFEGNETTNEYATGSLKNIAGNCEGIAVHGEYIKKQIAGDNNYVVVQVNFTSPGIYKNIYWYRERLFFFGLWLYG